MDSPATLEARHSDNQLSARLRGFGPAGLLAIVLILLGNFVFIPLSALLVLWWRHLSKTPWRAIGFVRPRSWIQTIAVGILFGALLKFTMKAVVMPLLGADPINQARRDRQDSDCGDHLDCFWPRTLFTPGTHWC
jgi:hypothetical protein